MDTWKERTIIRLLSAKYRLINMFSTQKAGKGSINVLIHPMQGRVIPKELPDVEPEKIDHLKSVDDLNVKLYDWGGSGDTTLLIHGWDSNSYRWYDMIDQLGRDRIRFVALDAPYHGGSDGDHFNLLHFANMIEVALKTFQPTRIVAHSLGALSLAHHLQKKGYHKLERLILLSPVADLSWHIDRYHQLLSLRKKTRLAMDEYFESFFKMQFREFNFRDFESELDCEVLIVHDELDPVVPISDSERIHEWFEGSELKTVRGLGHTLQGKEVYQIVGNFL